MALSPMMTNYLKTKEQYKDAILFYRLGDFYEMFFDDAIMVSKELEITLTGRDCGLEERAPMCGIPFHAASTYIDKLIAKGHKVAICEQLSDPQSSKGLVERGVIQVVTPGTVTSGSNLDERKNNFLACIYMSKNGTGVCFCDITTGETYLANFSKESTFKELDDALLRMQPSEIICNAEMLANASKLAVVASHITPTFNAYQENAFSSQTAEKSAKNHFGVVSLSVFGIKEQDPGKHALGALLAYLNETQKRTLSNINRVQLLSNTKYMHLDASTRRNLEITETMNNHKKKGSILHLLDHTKTSMGARKLRMFVSQPLADGVEINNRLCGVEEFVNNNIMRENVAETLAKIYDIERLSGKIAYGSISPKECLSLSSSLKKLPILKQYLDIANAQILKECYNNIIDLSELANQIDEAIAEDAPALLKDGGYIKPGYNAELDELRNAGDNGRAWIANYEATERERTGIKTLKIGFNKVFGYYIEITKLYSDQIPLTYIRKQTTVNAERYISPELKEIEEKILGSSERALKLENELYLELKKSMLSYIDVLQKVADSISIIDTLYSFAVASIKNNYVKPIINDDIKKINIVDGRHPVVESLLSGAEFVPNDTLLDEKENRTMVITGPNMAGKSTYMRQVAVISLMAQMGCFVPAKHAELAVVDKIFTRIGASDDLAFGQSTFMVEMTEVANIINNATENSLLILDEVGRGTSTYDGLSIAWAVMEYLATNIKAKTLFATHYHELCDLEGKCEGVKNYRVLIKEFNGQVIFLHKIARGSANRSFGIEVASLANLPKDLIERAKEILKEQERKGMVVASQTQTEEPKYGTTANINEVINILKEMDMNTISPIMAFGTLQNLVDKVKK